MCAPRLILALISSRPLRQNAEQTPKLPLDPSAGRRSNATPSDLQTPFGRVSQHALMPALDEILVGTNIPGKRGRRRWRRSLQVSALWPWRVFCTSRPRSAPSQPSGLLCVTPHGCCQPDTDMCGSAGGRSPVSSARLDVMKSRLEVSNLVKTRAPYFSTSLFIFCLFQPYIVLTPVFASVTRL